MKATSLLFALLLSGPPVLDGYTIADDNDSANEETAVCDPDTWVNCENSIELTDDAAITQTFDPGWIDAPVMAALLRAPPAPQCAASPEEAVARFQTGLLIGDINLAITFYDWGGLNGATADARIDSFMDMTGGSWQSAGERWRWLDDSKTDSVEFVAVKRDVCWFLRWESEGNPAYLVDDPVEDGALAVDDNTVID